MMENFIQTLFLIFVFRNVITLQIILRNKIPGTNNLFKVKVHKIKYSSFLFLKEYQIKKNSIPKINVASPNTNLVILQNLTFSEPRQS